MSADLSALREELLLHAAPRHHDGSPAWTLEDPGRGLFVQLGWAEAEMLARWHLGSPERIAQAVSAETTLRVEATEVDALARQLDAQGLLRLRGPQATERFLREARARQVDSWWRWLLHHYLFIRIPLLRPDPWLTRALPWVRRHLLTRGMAISTAIAGLLGLFLAARQWDSFAHTFLHFFTLEGAAVAALTLGLTKVLHELGHAFMAKHHGCRVATMGVAFMVMWPVLYTDASGAWRLRRRRQRLSIAAAGMMVETALAAWATLAWSFLPDGMLRSAAFMLATTTWLLTLAVNLNPLMRFDGYFLLADALNVPNLQARAFALARWRLREWLFNFGDPRPEVFAPWRERTLLVYSYAVWVYRLFLFIGIALLVYHFAFKLLGIVLFIVEIVFFVLRPITTEAKAWLSRWATDGHHRHGPPWRRRGMLTLGFALLMLLLFALPWRTRVEAPALARAAEQARLLVPAGARLDRIDAVAGQPVKAGTPLFTLSAPDLLQELQSLQRRLAVLAWQRDFQAMRQDIAGSVPVARDEFIAIQKRVAELERQQAQLTVVAPFDGTVADLEHPLATGTWLAAGDWLGTVTGPRGLLVEAYVVEADLRRVRVGDTARFVPDDPGAAAHALRVVDVALTATRRLGAAPELAAPHGGAIAAVRAPPSARAEAQAAGNEWQPEHAVYRVLLAPQDNDASTPTQVRRGTVLIDGVAESPLARVGRQALALLVREAGL